MMVHRHKVSFSRVAMLSFVLFCGASGPLWAEQPSGGRKPLKIAVMGLRAMGADRDTVLNVGALVVGGVQDLKLGTVISGEDIRAMVEFSKKQVEFECDKLSCIANIGGALGVDYLVSGSVGKLGNAYILSLRLVDVNHARVVAGETQTLSGAVEEFIPIVRKAVRSLFAGLEAPTAPPAPSPGSLPEEPRPGLARHVPLPPAAAVVARGLKTPQYWIGFLAPGMTIISDYNRQQLVVEAANFQIGLAGEATQFFLDLQVAQFSTADENNVTFNTLVPGLAGFGVRQVFRGAILYAALDAGNARLDAKVGGTTSSSDHESASVLSPLAGVDLRLGDSFTMGLATRYKLLLFQDGNLSTEDLTLRWGWAF